MHGVLAFELIVEHVSFEVNKDVPKKSFLFIAAIPTYLKLKYWTEKSQNTETLFKA